MGLIRLSTMTFPNKPLRYTDLSDLDNLFNCFLGLHKFTISIAPIENRLFNRFDHCFLLF